MNKKSKIKIDVNRIKKFLIRYRISALIICAGILLACISVYISYAYFQVTDSDPIIGGRVGKIADLELRVMVQNRDGLGNAIDGYSLYPYIPKAGYKYNDAKSYCTNGSTIAYANYQATITASKNDICYLYFDSVASLDITLNVYAQDVDSNGVGIPNQYTKLETTTLPSVGYVFNAEKSSCTNGSTITYGDNENLFTVKASGKDVCNAYMDALDVDISLRLYVQAKRGSSVYYEATNLSSSNYYELNTSKSSCTGNSTLSVTNQKVIISATSKTSCEAYLDISTGPILQSASLDEGILTMSASNVGSLPSTYYYSVDGGETYESTEDSTIEIGDVDEVKVYAADITGKDSSILTTSDYVFNGLYPYKSKVQTITIEQEGYYLLETWGAQGGSYNEAYAVGGKGGYSKGIVHLNVGDVLYIHIGGKGTFYATTTSDSVGLGGVNGGGNAGYRGGTGGGATDIRINQDVLYARVIVAGGGGGAYAYDETYNANGGAGGGVAAMSGAYYSVNYATYVGGGATQTSGGKAGISSVEAFSGKAGSFGVGGSTGSRYDSTDFYSGGAGGGGWYGGGAAGNYDGTARLAAAGGGGGSGYVYSDTTAGSYPEGCLLNESYYMTSVSSISGTKDFLSPDGVSEEGHSGDGYAKVTFVGTTLE